MTQRDISIFSDIKNFFFKKSHIKKIYNILDESCYRISDGYLSVAFLTKFEMIGLHKRFLGDDTLTDVITFDGDRAMDFAGEICVSPDYAYVSCLEHNTTFLEELTLYLVHGYLHLFGLNDISDSDILEMRQAEAYCMDLLKKRHAIPEFIYCT